MPVAPMDAFALLASTIGLQSLQAQPQLGRATDADNLHAPLCSGTPGGKRYNQEQDTGNHSIILS